MTLSGGNNLSPNEGTTYTYNYSISDADGDTIASVATSCGTRHEDERDRTRTPRAASTARSRTARRARSVSAQATDSGFGAGAGNNATQSISVQNVAPTVVLSGAEPGQREPDARAPTASTRPTRAPTRSRTARRLRRLRQRRRPDHVQHGDRRRQLRLPLRRRQPDRHRAPTRRTRLDHGRPTTTPAPDTDTLRRHGQQRRPDGRRQRPASRSTRARRCAPTASTRPTRARPTRSRTARRTAALRAAFVGPSSSARATGDGSFDCRFADDDPTGTALGLSTRLRSRSPTTTPAPTATRFDVTVNNVDPTVVDQRARARSTRAQTLRTYSFDTTDPGTPTRSRRHAGLRRLGQLRRPASSSARRPATAASTAASPTTTRPGPPPTRSTVSITVTDDDTGSDTDTYDVTVNNVAPTASVTGPSPVDEGDDSHLQLHTSPTRARGHVHGRRHLPEVRYRRHLRVGHASAPATGDGSFDCYFPDGPAHDQRLDHGHRRRRWLRHRLRERPDRRRRQRRPGRRPDRPEPGRRGLDPHLQLHDDRHGQPGDVQP